MACSRAQDRPRSTVRISSLRPATGCAFLPLRTASFVPRPTRALHTSAFRSSKDPSTPLRLTTLSCANSRRQCARRSTRAHSSTSLRKSFGAIPQDCPEVAKRKAPDPFMQFRGSETLDICYSHSIVRNYLQFVPVCRSLLQFVPFASSLKNCRESIGSNLGHGFSGHPRRFRGSRWVTALLEILCVGSRCPCQGEGRAVQHLQILSYRLR